jgi:hypothetical protein
MKKLDLTFPQLLFVVGTRAILGLGAGLLLADRLPKTARKPVGLTLAALGILTTIPAAITVLGGKGQSGRQTGSAAA